jgi:hypothetical protein
MGGRRWLSTGISIDEVARLLGCRSLDQAAEFVQLDWRRTRLEEPE